MAARIMTNRHGTLIVVLWWQGQRTWESTGEKDTPRARRLVEKAILDPVNAEMGAGTFTAERYLHYFPAGTRAEWAKGLLGPPPAEKNGRVEMPTLANFAERWMERNRPPLVRKSLTRDRRQHLCAYLLPRLGGRRLDEIDADAVLELREEFLARGLSVKTVRNVLDSTLRALIRDARQQQKLPIPDPLEHIRWPAKKEQVIDPFTAAERDRIVGWYREERLLYWPFVLTLFHTGMRPSEATALRWAHVDLKRATIDIRVSRHLGAENAPKTRGSRRTIELDESVVEALRAQRARGLHEEFVFVNKNAEPVHAGHFAKDNWIPALRGLEIRRRKFYATRHTFISLALTEGMHTKFVAEYCGTSILMIEQNYGKYCREQYRTQMDLLRKALKGVCD